MRINVLGDASRGVGIQGVLYVSKAGNDSTAVRGSLTLPYLTVQAALDDAHDGDTVMIGPGTFADGLMTIPVGLDEITIRGCGDVTILDGTNGDSEPALTAGTAVINRLEICDLQIISNTSASAIVDLQGTDTSELCRLRNVKVSSGVSPSLIVGTWYNVFIESCEFDDSVHVQQNDRAFIYDSIVMGTLFLDIDYTEALPADVSYYSAFVSGTYAVALDLDGVVQADFHGCTTGDVDCDFTTTVDPVGEGGRLSGVFKSDGTHGAVQIAAEAEGANTFCCILSGSISSFILSKVGDSGYVKSDLRGCKVAGAVTAGNRCTVRIQGGTYGSIVSTGLGVPGKIDRSIHRGTATWGSSPSSIDFDPPFITTAYNVHFEGHVSVVVSDKGVADFTVTGAPTTAEYTLIHDSND
jgi:hypothetical protein